MIRKIIVLFISIALLFVTGCAVGGENAESEYPTVLPSYEQYKGKKRVELLAFWSPPPTYESYNMMKECGFTSVLIDNKYDAYSTEIRDKILHYCDDLEIDAYFPINRDADANVISEYSSLLSHGSFRGFYCDEPILKSHMQNILNQIIAVNELSNDLSFICNVLGGYPDHDPGYFRWMFSSDEEFESNLALIYDDYDTYLCDFFNNIFDVYDNVIFSVSGAYPLLKDETEYGTSLSGGWLNVMGQTAEIVKNKGAKRNNNFIQSTAFHNGGDVNYRRSVSEDDIRWQINICLTYGVTDIGYFTYNSMTAPGPEVDVGDTALIYWTDESNYSTFYATDAYYGAKKVNEELSKFDYVYRSFQWQNVMFNKVSNCIETESNFNTKKGVCESNRRIKEIYSSDDLVIGCFVDEKNYDGFMFTNFDNTYISESNTSVNKIEINFKSTQKAVVYYRGEKQVVRTPNGVFRYDLNVGDSVFVIPIS